MLPEDSQLISLGMSDVRDFLRARIAELGMGYAEVSTAIGKNHAYIQQYLARGTPRSLDEETRKALATILRCSEDDLREQRPNASTASERATPRLVMPGPGGPVEGPAKDRSLPIYGRAQGGSYDIVMIPTDDRPVDWTYRPGQLEGVEGAYATWVYGDSMSPAYEHGDLALVHPFAVIKNGSDVHIVLNTDESFVKRLVSRKNGVIVLRQFNPDKLLEFSEEATRFIRKIVGKWNA